MKEENIVRQNLMDDKNYRPYCGSMHYGCYQPRTELRTDGQFICANCKWVSSFDPEFVKRYKEKHELN